jgi:hypothetical protein
VRGDPAACNHGTGKKQGKTPPTVNGATVSGYKKSPGKAPGLLFYLCFFLILSSSLIKGFSNRIKRNKTAASEK